MLEGEEEICNWELASEILRIQESNPGCTWWYQSLPKVNMWGKPEYSILDSSPYKWEISEDGCGMSNVV